MSVLSFTYNGVSSDTMGVDVLKLPSITKPTMRLDQWTVPGRSGTLRAYGARPTYEDSLVSVSLYLNYENSRAHSLADIKAWLTGSGEWTQSDMPGRKFRVHMTEQSDYTAWVDGFSDRLCTVSFYVEPYAYHTNDTAVTATSGGTINNEGTAYSQPLITITRTSSGSDFTLTLNGTQIDISRGYTGTSIEIDCEEMEVYGTTGGNRIAVIGGYCTMTDFPVLDPGENTISWTGTCNSVKVLRRCRDL